MKWFHISLSQTSIAYSEVSVVKVAFQYFKYDYCSLFYKWIHATGGKAIVPILILRQ